MQLRLSGAGSRPALPGAARFAALLVPVVALVVGLLGGPLPAATADATVGPVRVMVTGDSISHEFSGDYTWRYRLWKEFARQGVPVTMVGPRTAAYGPIPFWIVPAWRTADHHDALGGSQLGGQVNKIGSDVTTYKPDVILLMIGVNDLLHGRGSAAVIADMDAYLGHVFEASPTVRVVLSPILHTVSYTDGGAPRDIDAPGADIDTTNAGYAGLVARYAGEGRDIRTTATGAASWVPRRATTDGIHPNPTGETVLAQRYGTSLFQMGVLKQAPRITAGYVPWVTGARVVVRQSGRRVLFRWDYYRQRLTMHQGTVRIQGGRLRHPLVLRGVTYAGGVSTTRLRKGRYTVTLSPGRKWLVGPYGPAVSFRVR